MSLRRLAPVVLVLFGVVLYFTTLDAPFVWDDRHLVVESEMVRTLHPFADYFTQSFWRNPESGDTHVYYRPIAIFSLAIDQAVHSGNPAGFHLTNGVLHVLNGLLLYLVLRKYRSGVGVGLTLSASWLAHPRLTEAAGWVSGRTDVLATTFVLLALLAYRPRALGRGVLAALSLLLGLFCKEVALAGVGAVAAAEACWWARHRRSPRRDEAMRGFVALAACVGGAFGAYLLLRHVALGDALAAGASAAGRGFGERIQLAFAALGHYTQMFVNPWQPRLQIGNAADPSAAYQALGAGVVSIGLLVLLRFRVALLDRLVRHPNLAMGVALAAISLGLVLHLVPLSVGVVATDRFLYLPLVGVVLVASPFLQACVRGLVGWRRVGASVGALVWVGSLGTATFVRLGDWGNEGRLWAVAYANTPPGHSLPSNELGNVYFRAGLMEHAAALFQRAVEQRSDDPIAQANVANVLGNSGQYDAAALALQSLCRRHPAIPKYCLEAGLVELHRLAFDDARAWMRVAVERRPDYTLASDALRLVGEVEALVRSSDYSAHDAHVRTATRFHVAQLAGRHREVLQLASRILADATFGTDVRRAAAEYWVRFGPPLELERTLASPTAASVLDPALIQAAQHRIDATEELLALWDTLGISPRKLND